MKLSGLQLGIIGLIILGGGFLFFLSSQKTTDVEAKYREVVNVFDIARELNLDMEQFKADIDSNEVHQVVADQKAEGERMMGGSISTPTIYINGERLVPSGTIDDLLDDLKTKVDDILEETGEKPEVVEFFDFNCIHCANLEKGINDVAVEYADKMDFQKKYIPFLRSSSTTYAYAAEAAKRQGKFTEFSVMLFERIHNI